MKRAQSYTFINMAGLALGTLCCLYIIVYVNDQFNYDQHHPDAERIYRVTTLLTNSGREFNMATSSPPIGPALGKEFGEVMHYTRVVHIQKTGIPQTLVTYEDKSVYEKNAVLVDSTFFSLFHYPFAAGSAYKALDEPNTVVLDNALAGKLFGNEDPLGKVIQLDNLNGRQDLKVVGVITGNAGKSHLHAQLYIAMNSGGLGEFVRQNQTWAGNNFVSTYIKLHPQADAKQLERKLPAFLDKYGAGELRAMGMKKTLSLQPLISIHTDTSFDVEMAATVNPTFLYILMAIALLIQAVACINFMNLATAQAAQRGKEVGIRKVIGAGRKALIFQFMGESFLLVTISVLLALPLLGITLPYLNRLTQAVITADLFFQRKTWMVILAIVFGTAIVAGSYPALYLAAFNPVKVIKGNFTNRISAIQVRRMLVVSQFVLAIGLIVGIIVIRLQMNFIKDTELGFDQKQRLIFSFHTVEAKQNMQAFTEGILQLPEVMQASKTNNYPSQFIFNDRGVFLEGGTMAHSTNTQFMTTDEHFVEANGIALVSGRDFRQGDNGKVLINETLARQLNLAPETAPGARLYSQYEPNPAFSVEVAGVMKDFHYNSLHLAVRPFMLSYTDQAEDLSHLVVSLANDDYTTLLDKIASVWNKVLPNIPFDYAFMDQRIQEQYEKERTLATIINAFTSMTLFISCLGLFGLAAFSAEQRRKEIGIRKVLGASIAGIVGLLSRDFVKLVVIAITIASPVAWWAMNKWLDGFAYRIRIEWWMIAVAGLAAVVIALLTVSVQAIKAAVANPVDCLRNE